MKGFTLVELVVSLALIAIITLVGVMNFTDYNEKKLLQTEADGLAQELQELKVLAFSGNKVNDDIPEAYCLFKKENGYSELEVSQKRDALENVLIPEAIPAHLSRLRGAGFIKTDLFLKWFNFVSIICQKEKTI